MWCTLRYNCLQSIWPINTAFTWSLNYRKSHASYLSLGLYQGWSILWKNINTKWKKWQCIPDVGASFQCQFVKTVTCTIKPPRGHIETKQKALLTSSASPDSQCGPHHPTQRRGCLSAGQSKPLGWVAVEMRERDGMLASPGFWQSL